MNADIREFGKPVADAEYHLRLGGYCVIRRTKGVSSGRRWTGWPKRILQRTASSLLKKSA